MLSNEEPMNLYERIYHIPQGIRAWIILYGPRVAGRIRSDRRKDTK